jgi:hypothetical protein
MEEMGFSPPLSSRAPDVGRHSLQGARRIRLGQGYPCLVIRVADRQATALEPHRMTVNVRGATQHIKASLILFTVQER